MPDEPLQATGTPGVPLPGSADQIAHQHPQLWAAFQRLGEEASRAGPLDPRTRRLVHLALAVASESEGATHSHARRALAEELMPEELEHVALLAITTLGWARAMKGLNWIRDITRDKGGELPR
jgi:alkylhydroperoxidase/carboxymuconolactone decarboxylase family protein YurZ